MTSPADSKRGVLSAVPFLLAAIIAAPFCFHQIGESDFGWHLAVGRVIAQRGMPHTNALCWTTPDVPWRPTSWLFDWLSYLIAQHLGLLAAQVFIFALLCVALIGGGLACMRVAGPAAAWLTPLLAVILIPRISERPHMATWPVLAWVVWLCVPDAAALAGTAPDRWERSFRRRLWCLPLIVLGGNFHSGAVFPSILLAIYCAEGFLLSGRRAREIGLAAAGFVALVANPGGTYNAYSVLRHVNVGEVIPLVEFQHPDRWEIAFYLLIPLALAACMRAWRVSPAIPVSVVVFGFIGWWAVRLIYEFGIVAMPALAVGIEPMTRTALRRVPGLLAAAALFALAAWRCPWFDLGAMGPEWDARRLPVGAARFIRAEHLDGRMYNGFTEGGYLEWALPELHWFQDARVLPFPPDFLRRQERMYNDPIAFRRWLDAWKVEWAVTTRLNRFIDGRSLLHDSPDWALVYWDEASELYIRRGNQRLAPIVQRLEYRHFLPWGSAMASLAAASRSELLEWAAELQHASSFDGTWLAACAVSVRLGGGADACDQAAAVSDSPDWRARVDSARRLTLAQ